MTEPDPAHIDAVTLVLANADGQHWASLDDAPSRGQFMGYPDMARAILTDPTVHAALVDALTRHGVIRTPDPATAWTVHVDVPKDATEAELDLLSDRVADAAYDMPRGQWDALVSSHTGDCAGSDHCCGPRPAGPPYPRPEATS